MTDLTWSSLVAATDAAASSDTARYFADLLRFETDSWDVHHDPVRGSPGATSSPTLRPWPIR